MTTSGATVSPGLPGKFTSHAERKPRTPTCEFVSRGSVMLRAALNEKLETNKGLTNQNINLPKRPPVLSSLSCTKKRPNRNVVLFTEPLVTNQFEYEQTTLPDTERRRREPSEDVSDEKHSPPRRTHGIRTLKKSHNAPKSFRHKSSPQGEAHDIVVHDASDDDDDDSEDVFIMASSTFPDIGKKNPNKRSHCEQDDDSQDQSSSSESGSLFSSPKVAKIAPYYHDQYEAASDLKSMARKQSKKIESQKNEIKNDELANISKLSYIDWLSNRCVSMGNYLSNQMNKLIF